jgi:hypothetical protein
MWDITGTIQEPGGLRRPRLLPREEAYTCDLSGSAIGIIRQVFGECTVKDLVC